MIAEQLDFYQETENLSKYQPLVDLDTVNLFSDSKKFYQKRAEYILNGFQQKLDNGEFLEVPLAINVLSTANKYLEEDDQTQKAKYFQAIEQDSSRLIAEAMRKNSWEYYPPVFEEYDPIQNDLKSNGINLSDVLRNGLSPLAKEEEKKIRVQEFVEHQVNLEIINLIEDDHEVRLLSIKECPDYVIDEYVNNKSSEKLYGGYVPEIEKMVIQLTKLSKQGASIELIGLSGKNIDHQIITQFLSEKNIIQDPNITKMELRSKQFIVEDDSLNIFDFVEQLDEFSSEKTGKNIFLGEIISDNQEKDYLNAIEQSISRQKSYETKVKNLSRYLIDLCEQGNHPIKAEQELVQFLKRSLFNHVLEHNEQAKTIFNDNVARDIAMINVLIDNKETKQAQDLMKESFNKAPLISFCGAGSCGLIAVSQSSLESKTVHSLGLKGEVIKDTVRACIFCGKKEIFYDTKGNKACANCKSSEINKNIKSKLRKTA